MNDAARAPSAYILASARAVIYRLPSTFAQGYRGSQKALRTRAKNFLYYSRFMSINIFPNEKPEKFAPKTGYGVKYRHYY